MWLLVSVVFIVGLIVAAALVFAQKFQRADDGGAWPYEARNPLTRPEQILFHRLVDALPECIVLAQVQLSRVLGVKHGYNARQWNNRINRMSLDFLVCLKDGTIVAAIELDDRSHDKPDRQLADAKKSKALAAAQVPLIRWQARDLPSIEDIRLRFTGNERSVS